MAAQFQALISLLQQVKCTKLAPILASINVLSIPSLLSLTLDQLLSASVDAGLDENTIQTISSLHPLGWNIDRRAHRLSDHWTTATQTTTGTAPASRDSCGRWLEVNDSAEVLHPVAPKLVHWAPAANDRLVPASTDSHISLQPQSLAGPVETLFPAPRKDFQRGAPVLAESSKFGKAQHLGFVSYLGLFTGVQ